MSMFDVEQQRYMINFAGQINGLEFTGSTRRNLQWMRMYSGERQSAACAWPPT